jgi:hypothetical protein
VQDGDSKKRGAGEAPLSGGLSEKGYKTCEERVSSSHLHTGLKFSILCAKKINLLKTSCYLL